MNSSTTLKSDLCDAVTAASAGLTPGGRFRRPLLVLVAFALIVGLPAAALAATLHQGALSDVEANGQSIALIKVYDIDVARHFYSCPEPLVLLCILTSYATPLLMLVLAFDRVDGSICGGVSAGWLVVRRSISTWITYSLCVLAVQATVWAVIIARYSAPTSEVLLWGASIFAWSAIVAAPYACLSTFLSASFRRPWRALVSGVLIVFALGIVHSLLRSRVPIIAHAMPQHIDQLLLAAQIGPRFAGFALAAVWCGTGLLGAAWMTRLNES